MFVPKLNDWHFYCDKLNPNEEIKIKSVTLKMYLFALLLMCVHLLGWVKCGGENLSMFYHIWPSL